MRLQDNLGTQIFQENFEKLFEPVTDKIKKISEHFSQFLTESSIENNHALEYLHEKISNYYKINV